MAPNSKPVEVLHHTRSLPDVNMLRAEIINARFVDSDDIAVQGSMGYRQELLRGFNGFMAFAFCFTAVAVLTSVSVTYGVALTTGGPAVVIWGWLVCSLFSIITGLAMAELSSALPSAGSVYQWAGKLGGPKWGPICAFYTGWRPSC